ncbi:MAG: class I SAM-dependent methyltransferase [Candidatus Levybacteria bacterium]|nr:class I SAM-dependent methyltransferase [Candidatus Levybacteria bacterium]
MTFEERCKNFYKDSVWVSLFTAIRFWTGSFVELEKLIPKQGVILDLGCGYGILTNYLALYSKRRQMIGIDIDTNKINHAGKGIENVRFSVGDATKMKLKKLDAILIHDVLHHLNSYEDQEKLIKECASMLKKKGKLFIVEVDNKPLWKLIFGRLTDFLMYKGNRVFYRYKKEMLNLLERYFSKELIHTETFTNNPFPQVLYVCQKK